MFPIATPSWARASRILRPAICTGRFCSEARSIRLSSVGSLNALHHRVLTAVSETRESYFSIQLFWTLASGVIEIGTYRTAANREHEPKQTGIGD